MPLLFLLLLGGTAAAPTPEAMYRAAAAAPPEKASAIVIEALKRYGNSDDPWVWRLRIKRADTLTSAGKAEEARALLRDSLPQSLRDSEVEVLWLVSHVYAGNRLRDPKVASQIERAYVLAKKKYPHQLADVLVFRAIVDPDNTPKWMDEAIRHLARYPDATYEHRVRGMMGLYLAQNERFDEAIPMWEQALVREQQLHLEAYVQKTEGNLGWAYQELGDYEQAAELLARALAGAIRVESTYDMVPWTYQLGNVRLQQDDLAAAEKQYLAALKLANETKHLQRPIILSLLANYNLRVGRLAEARRYVDESLRQAKAAKNANDELAALIIAGRIDVAEGKLADGERRFRNVLARGKSSISTTAEAHGRLAQLYEKRGNFSGAREQFRRMLEKVFEARESIEDRDLRFSFFTAVSDLLDAYVDFFVARGQLADALAVTEASRAQTLGEALPDLGKTRDVRTIARDTGATILCYWLGRERSYLWIVTPQKIDVAILPPRRTIDDAVEAYKRELLPRGTLSFSGARGSALWQMLVAPAARSIARGSRVIVVPDRSLHAFNMETLVVPGPNRRYWIDDVVISTAASLALLVPHDRKATAAQRLLMVGDTPPPSREFVPLPRARQEMRQIEQHFGRGLAVTLSGAKATPAAYRKASPEGFAYLHFVAHGVSMRQKPLDSAIVLARDGMAFKLYARDIVKQPLTARLVTISSCHGAGTRAYAGEGLVGLGWAFLHAGADNVVAALWEVSDTVTADLMDEFYGNLVDGAPPATALRDAKLALKARGGPFARPFYWAPFLLYGNS